MPRLPRLLLSKSFYHIMTRGNNRNIVFKSNSDYIYFLDLIIKYKQEHPFDIYHYCLMPNHTHFLIQTKKAKDFSNFMKKLNLAYYHYYRKKYGWVGHFWQNRFKSQAVGKDDYFIQCGKYIELNPVRSNIVDKPEDYQYSSYNYYSNGDQNELITIDFFYQEMGKNKKECQQQYKKLVISEIIQKTYNRKIWGSDHQRYYEKQKIDRKLTKA